VAVATELVGTDQVGQLCFFTFEDQSLLDHLNRDSEHAFIYLTVLGSMTDGDLRTLFRDFSLKTNESMKGDD